MEHQVRVGDVLVAPGEPAALEVVRGARTAAQEQPLRPDERPAPQLRSPTAASRPAAATGTGCRPRGDPGGWRRRRAGRRRRGSRAPRAAPRPPDARQLEQLRRVDRAAGEDDLAALDPLRAAALPLDVDRDGAPAIEHDPGHERPRPQVEVPAAANRPQVRLRGAQPPARDGCCGRTDANPSCRYPLTSSVSV